MHKGFLLPVILLLPALAGCSQEAPDDPGAPIVQRVTFLTIPSIGGHFVPATIYRPDTASAEHPVPVVLQFHGWGGSRETRLEAFRDYTDAGLGVVALDMRGHGEARGTSQARVASPDYEVRDVAQVLDYLATLDWVLRDAPGDPRVGAMGESYGGAMALMGAALDMRFDAVVAKDTWNDLAYSMAPGGVPKTGWFASLWLSAAMRASMHPEVRLGFDAAVARNTVPDGSQGLPNLLAQFAASSPANHGRASKAPTLLIQGVSDTLFDLGQAMANQRQLQDEGIEAVLVTHYGGHRLGSREPVMRASPCGDLGALTMTWMQYALAKDAPPLQQDCIALQDGSHAVSSGSNSDVPTVAHIDYLQVQPGNATSRAGVTLNVAPGKVVGSIRVNGTTPPGAGNATIFWSLELVAGANTSTVNQQITAQRLPPDGAPFSFDLAAVALRVGTAEQVNLVVQGRHPDYAVPALRAPVRLRDLQVTVPHAA